MASGPAGGKVAETRRTRGCDPDDPPTLGGGNIDINLLGRGATFDLPVFAEGALFYVGDPHLAMGNGEVAADRDGVVAAVLPKEHLTGH